jgi:hypothetical protein
MTDYSPRFAAKHRESFAFIEYDQLTELRIAIKLHIICAYLYIECAYNLAPVDNTLYSDSILFDKWVSLIYNPPSEMEPKGEYETSFMNVFSAAAGLQIRDVAINAGIEWDNSPEKGNDNTIVWHYFDAGTTLRYSEAMLGTKV